jgi:hypothetical protein
VKQSVLSIKGLGICFTVLGFFALTYGTTSGDRDALVEASLRAGGIVFPLGLLLLTITSIRAAIRRRREKLQTRRGFEVLAKTTKSLTGYNR